MSAAAAKRTVLAAVSIALLGAVSIAGSAGGAPSAKRDRVPPSPPSNLHVAAATPSLVTTAWDPAQDDVGVAGYYVYGDTGRAAVASTSYTVTSLGCGESGGVSVAAYDRAGNRSPRVTATISTAPCPDTKPPSTPSGFRQAATTQDAVVLGWNASSDDVGVVEYGVYRNLARVTSPVDPTVTLSGLTCGSTYAYAVDAVDGAGNRSPLGTAYVQTASCGDGQPPSVPTNLIVTSHSTSSLSVSWSPSNDDVGVTGYRVSVGGAPAMTVSQPSAMLAGLACGTSYAIGVDAFDAAGNRSAATALSASTDACSPPPPSGDTTPPSTPTGLAASSVSQTGLTLNWNPSSDNVGILGYDVYRSGTQMATVTSTSSSQTGLSCGTSYGFAVVARDAAGNSSQQAQLNASTSPCSTPPPPAGDTTPPSQPSNLGIASVTRTSVSLTWGPSTDNVGVAGYRTYVNGAPGSTSTQLNATVSSLTCGTAYTFEVDAYDAANNRSTRASVIGSTAACPDAQPPTAPTNVVATSRTATSIAVSWSASNDNVGVTGYGLYRGGASAGTSPSTTGIFIGLTCNTNYTLALDAYDAAGNRSSQTVVMVATTTCPDTTPPSTPTGLAASNVSQTGLALTWNASTDNVGVTAYDIYRNGTKMPSVTSTSSSQTGLSCGTSYTFAVVALDAADNFSQQAQLSASTTACSAPPPPPSEWTFCANEGQQCSFSGAMDVRYGANGTFTQPRAFTGGVFCSNSVFGDPLVGVAKRCETRSATSTPPPPPSTTTSGPITITAGGTYSGNWTSTSSTPAVRISTSEPVVIQNSTVTNLSGGELIRADAGSNVTIDRVSATGGSGYFFIAHDLRALTIRNCTIEKTSGIYVLSSRSGAVYTFTRNKGRNLTPPSVNGTRSWIQLDQVWSATVDISWNQFVNVFGESGTDGDMISLHRSANAKIHDNFIEGSFPASAGSGHSGSAIMIENTEARGNEVWNNQIVATTNAGIGIAGGSNNKVHDNRLVSSGKTPDGQTLAGANVGIYVWNSNGTPDWGGNDAWANVVGWTNASGQRNDWWMPNCSGSCSGTALSGTVTRTTEQAEYQSWLAKLSANGMTVGA